MTPLIPEYQSLLDRISLAAGTHPNRDNGLCVMEAAAWIAGQPHSDSPPCVSSVIGAFLRNWNDALPDNETRDRLLKPLLPAIIGTASTPDLELRRSYMALDWFIREHVPAWFDLTPSLKPSGDALRAADEIISAETLASVRPMLEKAQSEAAAAAKDAAWDAAWDAARAAAGAAARAAAWAAAGDAAWDAAGAAAWAAAGDAAWDAAGAAAWAAARDAAGAAARAAARAALKPTVERLQVSAQNLVRRMCEAKSHTPRDA